METWFGIVTRYSKQPPPSSGIIAAIQFAETYPVGVLKFQKNEGSEWLAALYDQDTEELIALSSIEFYYQNGHLAELDIPAPVWLDMDDSTVEQAHEFLVNGGEKPVWWRGNPDA